MCSNRLGFGLALALVLSWGGPSARAGLYFGDGLTHVINTSDPDITLANQTTLQVVAGAAIVGAPGAVGITGSNSYVQLSGGSVMGGAVDPNTGAPQDGVDLRGGSFTATGGTVTGGAGTSIGSNALDLASATATISGGTFSAGSNTFAAGYGLIYVNSGVGTLLSISGGSFTGGNRNGAEAAALTLDLGTASISGGSFQGTGATQSLGATLTDGAQLNISGGTFGSRITASVDTTGGSLNFSGSGLSFTPSFTTSTSVLGLLSGTLSNGQSISQTVFFIADGPFQVRAGATEVSFIVPYTPAVPEPASVAMMAVGLAIAGLVARRRPRRA